MKVEVEIENKEEVKLTFPCLLQYKYAPHRMYLVNSNRDGIGISVDILGIVYPKHFQADVLDSFELVKGTIKLSNE